MTGNGPNGYDAHRAKEVGIHAPAPLVFDGLTLCSGSAEGSLLYLAQPLSFWGGTDRETGRIIDIHHPQQGVLLGGTVLVMEASRGSSSSSSVLAEQLRAGVGPAAILLTARDAIVCLGVLAAAELYDRHIPVVLVAAPEADRLRQADRLWQARLGGSTSPQPLVVSVTAEPEGLAAVALETPNT